MNFLIKHSKIALGYFLIIACLGVLLRLFMVADIPTNYKYLIHTHSHVALLGWVYIALTTLIFKIYLSNSKIERAYKRLFWFTQLTIIGMLVSFPFTGYAMFSIVFSTLFLIASYLFVYLVFKYTSVKNKQSNSYKCIRFALWYMVISSLGPWALGIIMNTMGSESELYRNAIYFYLHFQYNGWFILSLFGIFFYILEQQKVILSKKIFQSFFWLFNMGVLLTFCISLLWMKPIFFINILSGIGGLFQILAFVILIKFLYISKKSITNKNSKLFLIGVKLIASLLSVKLVMQFIGALPYSSNIISTNLDFVIGYIHWIFLGVVSISTLIFLYYFKLIYLSKKSIFLFLIGFLLTEVLIFYKGYVIWQKRFLIDHYFWYLIIVSCLLLLAIMNIFLIQFGRKIK